MWEKKCKVIIKCWSSSRRDKVYVWWGRAGSISEGILFSFCLSFSSGENCYVGYVVAGIQCLLEFIPANSGGFSLASSSCCFSTTAISRLPPSPFAVFFAWARLIWKSFMSHFAGSPPGLALLSVVAHMAASCSRSLKKVWPNFQYLTLQ